MRMKKKRKIKKRFVFRRIRATVRSSNSRNGGWAFVQRSLRGIGGIGERPIRDSEKGNREIFEYEFRGEIREND